ncbi:MAG: tetratricopeptide repeat protein [Deltaproteobacteria bacterium]|nr:tetratricopeptide repeat protein [Deltaproteobacteria bacterium]
MTDAGPEKTIGKKRAPEEGEPPPAQATADDAPLPEEEEEPLPGPDAMPGWGDTLDKARKRFEEFVDKNAPKAKDVAKDAAEAGKKMVVDLSGGVENAFGTISEEAKKLMEKGQHTKVRIKFRERQIAELPIAVVAAAEVASLWWFGPLRLLLGHVVGKTVLDVEFVSNADAIVAEGRALLADGELERALGLFDKALSMDRSCAGAYLGRGIALKLKGDRPGARAAFQRAEECDKIGETGREARRHLDNLKD